MKYFALIRATWIVLFRRALFPLVISLLGLWATDAAAQTAPPVSVTFSATPDPVIPGEALVFEIHIANPSTSTATGAFTVTGNIPQYTQVTYVPNGSCNGACRFGNTVNYNVPSLAPGASTLLQFTAVVDNTTDNPAPPDGTTLSADISVAVNGKTVQETATAQVITGKRSFSLALSDAPGRVVPGATMTYVVSYGNVGSAATSALLKVPVPAGTTFVSATGGGSVSSGVVQWDLGSVASGFADRRQVTFQVAQGTGTGTVLETTAEIVNSSTQKSLVRDSAFNLVAKDSPLEMYVSATPDPASPGDSVVYDVDISNLSSSTATDSFSLWVRIPEYSSIAYVPNGSCNGTCRFGYLAYYTVPSLDPGASTKLKFTLTVDNTSTNPPPPVGTILETEFSAFVFGTTTARHAVTIGTGSHLSLGITASTPRPAPGDTYTYSLTFGNAGSAKVPTVLSMPLPAGTTFVSATGGGSQQNGVVQWDLGSFAPGYSDHREVTVKVTDSEPIGSTIYAFAELRNSSTSQSYVRESMVTFVSDTSPLSVVVRTSPDPVSPGGTIVYEIDIANQSPNTATPSFTLWSSIPEFMTIQYVPNGSCNGTCRHGYLVYYTVPSLAPGASTKLQFTATVDDSATNPPPPTGTVLSSEVTAFVFGGFNVRHTIVVGDGSNLDLGIDGAPSRVAPGADITYVVTYGNTGTSAVPMLVRLPVPVGTTFVSATGGGQLSGDAVQWSIGALPAGFSDSRSVTVKVADGAPDGELIEADAELRDPTTNQSFVRRSTSTLVASTTLLSVSVKATPDPVAPGNSVVYSIGIANLSTNTPTGSFTVWATIPEFVAVSQVPSGSCNGTCRKGYLVYYTVPSIPAGGNANLQFTAVVDNTTQNPPPPNGTVLSSVVTAFVFGGVQTSIDVQVGSSQTTGNGSNTFPNGGAGGVGGSGGTTANGGTSGGGSGGTLTGNGGTLSSGGSGGAESGGATASNGGTSSSGGATSSGGEAGESGSGGAATDAGTASGGASSYDAGSDAATATGAADGGSVASGAASGSGGASSSGTGGSNATAGNSSTSGGAATADAGTGSPGTDGGTTGGSGKSGCSCSLSSNSPSIPPLSLAGLLALGLVLRRRRAA